MTDSINRLKQYLLPRMNNLLLCVYSAAPCNKYFRFIFLGKRTHKIILDVRQCIEGTFGNKIQPSLVSSHKDVPFNKEPKGKMFIDLSIFTLIFKHNGAKPIVTKAMESKQRTFNDQSLTHACFWQHVTILMTFAGFPLPQPPR